MLWLFSSILFSILIWICITDYRKLIVPDLASILLVLMGLIYSFIEHGDVLIPILSVVLWFTTFYLIAKGFKLIKGHHGLGLGDAKLMAGVGAWLGPILPIQVVMIGSISAIGFVIVRGYAKQQSWDEMQTTYIPFAPFLSVAFAAVWAYSKLN